MRIDFNRRGRSPDAGSAGPRAPDRRHLLHQGAGGTGVGAQRSQAPAPPDADTTEGRCRSRLASHHLGRGGGVRSGADARKRRGPWRPVGRLRRDDAERNCRCRRLRLDPSSCACLRKSERPLCDRELQLAQGLRQRLDLRGRDRLAGFRPDGLHAVLGVQSIDDLAGLCPRSDRGKASRGEIDRRRSPASRTGVRGRSVAPGASRIRRYPGPRDRGSDDRKQLVRPRLRCTLVERTSVGACGQRSLHDGGAIHACRHAALPDGLGFRARPRRRL